MSEQQELVNQLNNNPAELAQDAQAPVNETPVDAHDNTDEAPATPEEKLFTQSDLNKINAREKEKYRQRLQQELAQIQQQYQQMYGQPSPQVNTAQPQNPLSDFEQQMQIYHAKQKLQEILANEQRSIQQAAQKYEDFTDYVNDPNLPVSSAMREAIALTGNPGDFWYTVAKNHRSELDRIASLPPVMQQAEILRLEGRLSAGTQTKVTAAPQPLNVEQDSRVDVSSNRRSSVDEAHLEDFNSRR